MKFVAVALFLLALTLAFFTGRSSVPLPEEPTAIPTSDAHYDILHIGGESYPIRIEGHACSIEFVDVRPVG